MNKKVLTIIGSILLVAALGAVAFFSVMTKKIPSNPPETIGNFSGNLNNCGLFCESDDVIYFSNASDNHYLYSMNSDGSDIKRIVDVPVAFINSAGDYLYFYYDDQGDAKFMGFSGNMRGIYRIEKKGKDSLTCLDRCTSGIVSLLGNELYYQHYDNTDGMTLYHSSLDGKDKGKVVNDIINPACILYGNIYYPDQNNNFYLNEYTPGASFGSLFLEHRMYNPTASGDYIYYMNVDDNYRLYRYDLFSGLASKITNERIDAFNVYGDIIFYQTNKHAALYKAYSDGSDSIKIADGNYCNINCTSTYTFFQPFNDSSMMLYTPTYGNGNVAEFIPIP